MLPVLKVSVLYLLMFAYLMLYPTRYYLVSCYHSFASHPLKIHIVKARLLSVIGQGAKLLLLFYWRISVLYENYMNHSLPSDIITMMFSLGFAKNKTPSKITLCT